MTADQWLLAIPGILAFLGTMYQLFLQGKRESKQSKIDESNAAFTNMNNLITTLGNQITMLEEINTNKTKQIGEMQTIILDGEKNRSRMQSSIDDLTLRLDNYEKRSAKTPAQKKEATERIKKHITEMTKRQVSQGKYLSKLEKMKGE